MKTNILKAILNIVNLKEYDFSKLYSSNNKLTNTNRVSSTGELFEMFIKDSLSNSFDCDNKEGIYKEFLSYLGNKNNPPDMIIKNGDAIEAKKDELNKNSKIKSTFQLNSSYPLAKLYSNNPRITKECRNCEDKWGEKDIIYALGSFDKNILKRLFFVYGDIYAQNNERYMEIMDIVRNAAELLDLELSPTNELGRINNVDILGITDLRIRGMWIIKHPLYVYDYLFNKEIFKGNFNEFSLYALMKKEKYNSFPKEDRKNIENNKKISIENVKIKDPNDITKLIDSVLIGYGEK